MCINAAAASSDVSEIAGRTQRYSDLLAKMDAEALAAFYVADAQVSVTGGQAIKGREAIKAHLQANMGYQVLSDVMTADSIAVNGAAAAVDGTYTQQMRTPKGKEFSAHGKYKADWVKDKDGVWRIKAMVAMPAD
ncbi:MAG: nuclear transport factor 2 family protein [Nevskia sp.]|nr:nuclear transport factor 2 family protein [Nevskia sp.]